MEQINVMEEVTKMLLEFLRKQAFAVVILVFGLVGLVWFAKEQKAEFSGQLSAMEARLVKCGEAREADAIIIRDLSVKLATVTERVDILSGMPTAPRNRRN